MIVSTTFDVDDLCVGVLLMDGVGNGMEKMGLAQAGRAVNKQGIIDHAGVLGNGDGTVVGKTVGGAHHKGIKGELVVDTHRYIALSFAAVLLQLLVIHHHQGG